MEGREEGVLIPFPRKLFFSNPSSNPTIPACFAQIEIPLPFFYCFFFHESQSQCTKSHFPAPILPLHDPLYDILGSDCCKAKAILAIFIVCPVNNLKLLLSHLTWGYVSRVLLKRTKQLKNLHRVLIRIFKYRLNLSPYYVTVYQDFKSLFKASRKQDLNNTVQRNLGKFAVTGTAQKVFEWRG